MVFGIIFPWFISNYVELHETFLRIACPVCGCEMSATDMKSNGDTDDGMFEQYRCGCGAWFTVTVEINL